MTSKIVFKTTNTTNTISTQYTCLTPLSDNMDINSDNDSESDSNCDEFVKFISTLNIDNTQNKSNKRKKTFKRSKPSKISKTSKTSKTSKISKTSEISKISNNAIKTSNNAIIYARCSTARQNSDNLQSLTNQVVLCIDYCIQNKLNVIDTIREIHNGHDMSKLKINSIPDIHSNINIIIADPSRMSRNVSDANNFIIQCKKNNIKLHFARDNLVTDNNEHYKKVINLVCDAYYESQLLSKRLKTTFDMKKRHGSHIGSTSYGFKINEIIDPKINLKIRKLVPDKLEQDVIEIINRLYFGSDIKDFNNIFKKVSKNKSFVLKDTNNNKFDAIYYGNITYKDIADLLNENNIYKRNTLWTPKSISNILLKTEDFNIKYYDNLNDDNEMSCDDI
jgi:DNA invertase Pin-like site-specific DNA recombinase